MFPGTLRRPALGQKVGLGNLYDGRTDSFIHRSLFNDTPPATIISTKENRTRDAQIVKANTLKDKLDHLGIEPDLAASIMSGLAPVAGSGHYLQSPLRTTAMKLTHTTADEELNLDAQQVRALLAPDILGASVATHVVVGITWGAECIVEARIRKKLAVSPLPDGEAEIQLAEEFHQLQIHSLGGFTSTTKPTSQHFDPFEVSIFGGDLANDSPLTTSFQVTRSILGDLRDRLEAQNEKGDPILCTMVPLSLLALVVGDSQAKMIIAQPPAKYLTGIVQFFDDLGNAQEVLRAYEQRCHQFPQVVPPQHIRDIVVSLRQSQEDELRLKKDLRMTLQDVRARQMGAEQLWTTLHGFEHCRSSPDELRLLPSYTKRMDFAESVQSQAMYLGCQGPALSTVLADNTRKTVLVLHLSHAIAGDDMTRDDNVSLFLGLASAKKDELLVVADYDALGQSLDRIHITQHRNGKVRISDFLKHRKSANSSCIMRYNKTVIDKSSCGKPLDRRPVNIPCPHPNCSQALMCNWICHVCKSTVEYSPQTGGILYCDCGSCAFDQWRFKCNGMGHGLNWSTHDPDYLLQLLRALKPSSQLNILILGETGVGKSTWINAFVNYLTFDTLDEALAADQLKWVIPSSFSTQIKDPKDRCGRFVQKEVKVGDSSTEKDGSYGQSATQETAVYNVRIGNAQVRLIDTPGIGDTRGIDQDNKNMSDILRVLRTYGDLHGILILLKPNAARLTVMFRFCIKQLLSQLHRSAADNIVFGFTNTRGSNFNPGDTFRPLQTLLAEYEEVQLDLFEKNVFCFDSESFRFLAAQKQGIEIGLPEDNRRSWDHSVEESRRLVSYIQSLKPHDVRSTLNLNETREMIMTLQEPMAHIAQRIHDSIEVNKDQIKVLRTAQLSRRELESSLYIQRETMESYAVDFPRTVCTHHDCVQVQENPESPGEMVCIYNTVCHEDCRLGHSVTRNQKGHPALERCSAMNRKTGMCKHCGHNYLDHMHLYYDYKPVTRQFMDEAVSKDLIERESAIELQERGIQMRMKAIREFRSEQFQVKEAAVQFGFFLKRHAIEPYNDATLEYIEHLINREKMKINNGGYGEALSQLEKHKAEHQQAVAVLTDAMERGDNGKLLDDGEIRGLIDSLYRLPHFGGDLKRVVGVNQRAVAAAFREKSLNISVSRDWTNRRAVILKRTTRKRAAKALDLAGGSGQDSTSRRKLVKLEPEVDTRPPLGPYISQVPAQGGVLEETENSLKSKPVEETDKATSWAALIPVSVNRVLKSFSFKAWH